MTQPLDRRFVTEEALATGLRGYVDVPEFDRIGSFQKAQGAICFSWDDGFSNWLDIALAATARGQRHTFCIQTGRIDTGGNAISTDDILAIQALGHEIAAHTVTHPNMASLSAAQRANEYDSCKATLEAIIGEPVTTFVWPVGSLGGAANNTTDKEIFGRFERVLDTANVSRIDIADRFGMLHVPRASWRVNEPESLIRMAARTPTIVNIYGHGPDISGIAGEPTMARVLAAMDLAQSLGVPCVTSKEAFPGGGLLSNPNFEDGTLGAWRQLGSSTASTVQPCVSPPAGMACPYVARVTVETAISYGVIQMVPVVPGKKYTLSFRARVGANGGGDGSGGTPTLVNGTVYGRLANATDYQGTVAAWVPVTTTISASNGDKSGAWNNLTLDYVIPDGVRFARVELIAATQIGIVGEFTHVWFGETKHGNFG